MTAARNGRFTHEIVRTYLQLPNPLDLALFDKTCFLNNGEIQISRVN